MLAGIANAQDIVVINSENWQDVYNGMVYANINGKPSKFLLEYKQGIELIQIMEGKYDNILVIQSEDSPVVSGYGSKLQTQGFSVERMSDNPTNLNLELARKSGVKDFIIMDDSFGHNAISVGGYASKSRTMTIFADKENIDEVKDFLDSLDNPKVTIYSRVDREVREALQDYTVERINKGDKFSNNFEILKKHLALSNRGQVILTNGNFIEEEILLGTDPVILVGNNNVPEDVINTIKDSNVRIGIAVGTDIIANARAIKEATDINIFVKFAQGRNQQQLPLDTFNISGYSFALDITRAVYNIATKQLQLTISNPADNYLVFRGDYEIIADNQSIAKFSDDEVFFISSDSDFSNLYQADLTDYNGRDVYLKSNLLMGEDEKALEALSEKTMKIEFVEYIDNSDIEITDVSFDKKKQRFNIIIKNKADEQVYARATLVDLVIDNNKETYTSEKIRIEAKGEASARINAPLEEIDYEDNEIIRVKARFGQREDALIKSIEQEFPLKFSAFGLDWIKIGMYAGAALLIIIILLVIIRIAKRPRIPKHSPPPRHRLL